MIGVIVVALACAAAAYLILKRYYAPGALLLVGCITLLVAIFVGPEPLISGKVAKTATHNQFLDIVQSVTNLLKTRAGGLGMNIMAIAGFSTYMTKLGASKAMVDACAVPLKYIKAPYLVMTIAYALGIFFNVFIPSAAGLSLLMMVAVYPVVVAAGVSRQAAAATILVGTTFALSPGGANNLLASRLLNIHVTEFWAHTQLMIALVAVPVSLLVHYFVQKWFDKKDLESGRITQADFAAVTVEDTTKEHAPAFYALFPVIPVAMLIIFSPLVYKGIRMEFVTAMLTSTFIAFVIDFLCRRNLKESVANLKAYAEGMGKVFTSTVFLIVSAEVFAAGLMKSGGIATIIDYVSHLSAGAIVMYTAMFAIVWLLSFLVGSGNAAFFSFAPLIPKAAQAVGLEPAAMLSSFQLISGCGRSSSPIAGCTIAVSGISGVEPFVLIRRSIPVMIVTGIVIYVRTLTMI